MKYLLINEWDYHEIVSHNILNKDFWKRVTPVITPWLNSGCAIIGNKKSWIKIIPEEILIAPQNIWK